MDNLFNFLFPDYETQETNDIDSIVERESNRYGLDSGIVKALTLEVINSFKEFRFPIDSGNPV